MSLKKYLPFSPLVSLGIALLPGGLVALGIAAIVKAAMNNPKDPDLPEGPPIIDLNGDPLPNGDRKDVENEIYYTLQNPKSPFFDPDWSKKTHEQLVEEYVTKVLKVKEQK